MEWKKEVRILAILVGIFLVAYYLPLTDGKVSAAILEAFNLLQWYVRNHTLACVVPAMFIAGAITTFLSAGSVLKYLGPGANKAVAYSVASVAGTILAVCSCSVLPMFAGIYKLGAGLGPASAFLYSGPAINVLAVFLTPRVLGIEIGVARVVGAVAFAFLVGLGMALLFRRQESARTAATLAAPPSSAPSRSMWKNGLFLAAMILFLVFSDWFNPGDAVVRLADGTSVKGVVLTETEGEWSVQVQETSSRARAGDRLVLAKSEVLGIEPNRSWVMDIHGIRWLLAGLMALAVLLMAWRWFERDELSAWMSNTWDFTKAIVPLLFGGVFAVGFIAALLPEETIGRLVGDNSLPSVFLASVVGTLFYFATLTEIPITQALIEHGMKEGPALALLLAGPALSLPSILVLAKIMGWKKTGAFCVLVAVMATVAGLLYGAVV